MKSVTSINSGMTLRRDLLRRYRPYVVLAAWLSGIINLLYLIPSLFMLQVYDRVVPTGSMLTLALLVGIAMAGLALLSMFDWLRTRILLKAAARVSDDLLGPLLDTVLSQRSLTRTQRLTVFRELETIRSTLSGGAIIALFDAPWIPIYIIAATLLNVWIGAFTLVLSIGITVLAWTNERAVHPLYQASTEASARANARQMHIASFALEVRALGMVRTMQAAIRNLRADGEAALAQASFTAAAHSGLARYVRLSAQSIALALAAFLAVQGSLSAGAITVAMLLLGRALAPIELLVGSWRGIIRAQTALAALETVLRSSDRRVYTSLPPLRGAVSAEQLHISTPDDRRIVLRDVTFAVEPGDALALIGLSGAGKSTLLRALVGVLPAASGTVRYDGAALTDWEPETLARQIGYLPQDHVIFAGTVKDNIARFDPVLAAGGTACDADVIAAAMRAGAHEMILRLPAGYDTMLGHDGIGLSGGQAQRVCLARACYGNPRVMVLDEPCAHLDTEGKAALLALIQANRRDGVTTIFSSHDRAIVGAASKVMMLRDGRVVPPGEAVRSANQVISASVSQDLS